MPNSDITADSLESSATVINLKGKLNKFILTGPKAYEVLSRVLLPSTINGENFDPKCWWKEFFGTEDSVASNLFFSNIWKSFGGKIPQNRTALSLVVRDPRIISPPQKQSFSESKGQNYF